MAYNLNQTFYKIYKFNSILLFSNFYLMIINLLGLKLNQKLRFSAINIFYT